MIDRMLEQARSLVAKSGKAYGGLKGRAKAPRSCWSYQRGSSCAELIVIRYWLSGRAAVLRVIGYQLSVIRYRPRTQRRRGLAGGGQTTKISG